MGPIPYLELFWVGPFEKNTLYDVVVLSGQDTCLVHLKWCSTQGRIVGTLYDVVGLSGQDGWLIVCCGCGCWFFIVPL